jgi:hypothetical protein
MTQNLKFADSTGALTWLTIRFSKTEEISDWDQVVMWNGADFSEVTSDVFQFADSSGSGYKLQQSRSDGLWSMTVQGSKS